MDALLNSPLWAVLGSLATLIGVLPIIKGIFEKPPRLLRVNTKGFKQEKSLSGYLTPEEKSANKHVFTHAICVSNEGRSFIDVQDYLRPLTITYTQQAVIKEVQVVQDKQDAKPTVETEGNTLCLREPLNMGDVFTLVVILTAPKRPDRKIDCRLRDGEFSSDVWLLALWERLLDVVFRWVYLPFALVISVVASYVVSVMQNQAERQLIESAFRSLAFSALVVAIILLLAGFLWIPVILLRLKWDGATARREFYKLQKRHHS